MFEEPANDAGALESAANATDMVPLDNAANVVDVPETSCLVGQTIQDMRIRSTTGASVVAVIRDGTVVLNPDATHRFAAGDLVGVLGHAEQRQAFEQLVQGGAQPLAEDVRPLLARDGNHHKQPQE